MNEFDKELKETLANKGRYDPTRAESLRKDVVQMYEKKIRMAKILAWTALAICIPFEIGAIVVFILSGSTKVLLACMLVFLAAGQLEVLAKLWYWVFQSQMKIRKDVKEVELRIAELSSER